MDRDMSAAKSATFGSFSLVFQTIGSEIGPRAEMGAIYPSSVIDGIFVFSSFGLGAISKSVNGVPYRQTPHSASFDRGKL